MPQPFLAILGGARSGDPHAWEALVLEFLPNVRRLAGKLSGPGSADVDDIAQETFVRAFGGLAGFGGTTPGQFVRWLDTICTNYWADEGRRTHRREDIAPTVSLDVPVPSRRGSDPSGVTLLDRTPDPRGMRSLDLIEEVDLLSRVLTKPERRVYVLGLHGYSRDETASILGEEPKRIKYWRERARKKLGSVRDEWYSSRRDPRAGQAVPGGAPHPHMVADDQWKHLVEETMADVWTLARAVCGDERAAEDLAKGTYRYARDRWPADGSRAPGDLRCWILSICLDLVAGVSLEMKVNHLLKTSRCTVDETAAILRLTPATVEDLFDRSQEGG